MMALADETDLKTRVVLVKEQKEPMPQYRRSFIVILSGEAEAPHEDVFDLCDKDREQGVIECNLISNGNRFYKVVIFKSR